MPMSRLATRLHRSSVGEVVTHACARAGARIDLGHLVILGVFSVAFLLLAFMVVVDGYLVSLLLRMA